MVWEDFIRWLGVSAEQQEFMAEFDIESVQGLLDCDYLDDLLEDDDDRQVDDATKQKLRDVVVLLREKGQSNGRQWEKVQWRDDDTISDWIEANELHRKQQLSPFDIAIAWKLPAKVLSHMARDLDGGLEKAKSYTGMTFHHLLLGSEVPGYAFFARTFGTFQPRQDLQTYYKIVGLKVHASETCLVIFAVDVLSDREVALKLMVHEDQWQREADLRKKGPNGTLDAAHVVELLATIELDEAGLAQCHTDDRLCGVGACRYMHVMPRANRDLSDLLSHDRVAGYDIAKATSILRQVATHLDYLHVQCKMIHGDIKSRNLVETTHRDGTAWILIDLDAACAINSNAGQKITSSAFYPPEMARYEIQKQSHNAITIPPLATEALEMWYFGLMVLQMSTEDAPTLWQSTQADNLVKAQDLESLAYFWDTLKLEKVRDITNSSGSEWTQAADLALWLLQGKASRRPASMYDVLEHRFFKPDGKLRYFESVDETLDSLVKRQAEKLTAAITSRDSVAIKALLDHGDVHLRTLDASIGSSTVTPLMRAAFVGHVSTVEVLLGEINDSWPDEVRKDYLDQRTSLDFTAYMIACAHGHQEIAELLEKKGCDASLVNAFGENGAALLQASRSLDEDSAIVSLESYFALLDQKVVVMSCPEIGTLRPDGSEPFDQNVMDKVSELVKRGVVKLGFDRAGTSTAVKTEEENRKWSIAFDGTLEVTQVGGAMRSLGLDSTEVELQDTISKLKLNTNGFTVKSDSGDETTILSGTIDFIGFTKIVRKMNEMLEKERPFSDDELKTHFSKFARPTPEDVKKQIFKLTEWWNGYQSSVKAIVKVESQGFDGTLNVTCIEGGSITQLEAAEMARIMEEAKRDCSMSGVTVRYQITKMPYCDFLAKYEHEPGDRQQAREVTNFEGEVGDNARPDVHAQLAEARAQLAAKDEELASKDTIITTHQEEIAALEAQLQQLQQPKEGVPPV
jgi:serine/threonine protein kinase